MGSGSFPLSCGVFLPPTLLQAFPLLVAGRVLLLLSAPGVFVYSSCGMWVFLPLLCSFPPTTAFTSFSAPGCWACAAAPAFSSQLVVRDFPYPLLQHSGHPALFAMCLFVIIAYYSVFFSFFPAWGSVCSGGYADLAQGCLWEYCVPLSSPCGPRLPKPSGHCCLAVAREPSWFLHLT
jgi:hypothetical protein